MSFDQLFVCLIINKFINRYIYNIAVCPNCYKEIDIVSETQYDDIRWIFKNGKYVKENLAGDTYGKRCGNCYNLLPEDDEQFFMY